MAPNSFIGPSNYFIEFFAGSAGLSFEARRAGFNVISVDHDRNRHRPKVSQVSLDLTSDDSQGIALDMVQTLRPFAIHLGCHAEHAVVRGRSHCQNICSSAIAIHNRCVMQTIFWDILSWRDMTRLRWTKQTSSIGLELLCCVCATCSACLFPLRTRPGHGCGAFSQCWFLKLLTKVS